jgi:ferredoxin
MPVIRFVREGRDVECYPGENLREVALREGIQLYGLKGTLGNCGGCGQCITCFVEIPEVGSAQALSPRTPVEEQKLRRRPQDWRLACQALVQQSLLVITRPQVGLADKPGQVSLALATPLPPGPTSWPQPESEADAPEGDGEPVSLPEEEPRNDQ